MKISHLLILTVILTIIFKVVLGALGTGDFLSFIITVSSVLILYFSYWIAKDKKILKILEEDCDPEAFIEANEKRKGTSRYKQFQNVCEVNIAAGLIASGRFEEAINKLNSIDLSAKNSKHFEAIYHTNKMNCYVSMSCMEKATYEYESFVKYLRAKIIVPKLVHIIDCIVLHYQYSMNKNPETAKFFFEQITYLNKTYRGKFSKRQAMYAMYTEAIAAIEAGIPNSESNAIGKLKVVSREVPKFYIAKLAAEKLANCSENI